MEEPDDHMKVTWHADCSGASDGEYVLAMVNPPLIRKKYHLSQKNQWIYPNGGLLDRNTITTSTT